jgi:hypothetical protein
MQKKVSTVEGFLYGVDSVGTPITVPSGTQAIYVPVFSKVNYMNPTVPDDMVWEEHTYRRYNYSDFRNKMAVFFISDDVDMDTFEEKWEFINTLISFSAQNVL